VFPHRNIYEYTWSSSGGKTHSQIYHVFTDKGRHSCTAETCVLEGLTVIPFYKHRELNYMYVEVKEQSQVKF